ncbi:MAG: hypothetical protein NTV51_30545 [Verrucomicrobia bacterium]|nr:hypothetical protein [Verrucomicrobiota bacterium]
MDLSGDTAKWLTAQYHIYDALNPGPDNPAHTAIIKQALVELNDIHQIGLLPTIPVGDRAPKDDLSFYSPRHLHGPAGTRIDLGAATFQGKQIELPFHLAHEFWHDLDEHIWGRGTGFGSDKQSPALRELLAAIKKTRQYQWAKEKDLLEHRRYWARPTELCARAYSQWAALRSPSGTLATAFHAAVASGHASSQWTADDFKPVAAAFDRLFARKGWLP